MSKTIEFGHVSTEQKSPTHHHCPSHRYDPCIYDMRHFDVLHSKNMLNILVFQKLDGFEQPWSSAIQNRAQKFKWINFRCLVCRVKLTTLPKYHLNQAVYKIKCFPIYIYIYTQLLSQDKCWLWGFELPGAAGGLLGTQIGAK